MSTLNRWVHRLGRLLRRRQIEKAIDEEMRIHVEMETEHLMRAESLDAVEARRRALVAFGGADRAKEQARDARRTRWLEDLGQDARQGLRGMGRAPGFTLVAVATLALGIGATTAMFSVVSGVMLTPLPYPESDRLVAVWSRFLPESGFDFPEFPVSPPEYFDYRAQSTSLEDAAAHHAYRATLLADDGTALSIRGAAATANLFDVLRARPALGRAFTAVEDVAAGPSVAMLGHALWRRAFGGDSAVIGRTIRVNGRTAEVIGVMPAGFGYPSEDTELWTPIGLDPAERTGRGNHFLTVIARLSAGADLDRAHAEMTTLMAAWRAEYPDVHTGHFLFLRPLMEQVVGSAGPALLALLGAVGFVLLIVCANVANLLLARGEVRQRELAVRSALGAGRARLVRQFLAEGALLSLTGGLAGLVLAYVLVDITLALGAESIPRAGSIALDTRVLLFAGGIALFTTIIFAIAPSLRLPVAVPRLALGEDGRTTTSSGHGLRLRQALVTAQIAFAVVVVIGAGLMMRSYGALTSVDPGFEVGNVLVADLSVPSGDYPDADDVIGFYQDVAERLARLPGALAAGAVSALPLTDGAPNIDFDVEGMAEPAPGEPAQSGDMIIADHGYARTLGVSVVEGRFFEANDRAGSMPVTVVNRRLARMFWPGESALGGRIRSAGDADAPWLTIVGVIDDVQFRTLADEVRPAWYLPLAQMAVTPGNTARSFSVALRTERDPMLLARSMREVLRDVDPMLPLIRLRALDRVAEESVAGPRFTTTMLALFAALALVIGAIGIYGVLAYAVARRTREFGIRMALGADPRRLTGLVVAQGLRLVLAGLAIGILAALAATRLIEELLFGVSPTDPMTFAAVAAAVCLIAFAASVMPVRRALRADPLRSLRAD
ncbi:MAG TPA: ABC transporter permease [Longimicrobiales bacterium]